MEGGVEIVVRGGAVNLIPVWIRIIREDIFGRHSDEMREKYLVNGLNSTKRPYSRRLPIDFLLSTQGRRKKGRIVTDGSTKQ